MESASLPEILIAFGFAMFPVAMMVAVVMVQRFKTQERLRAIEKGIPLPPALHEHRSLSPEERLANFRVAGIICVAVGLGLLVLFAALAATISTFPKGVIAVSAVPFFIGLGLLIEYRIRRLDGGAGGR